MQVLSDMTTAFEINQGTDKLKDLYMCVYDYSDYESFDFVRTTFLMNYIQEHYKDLNKVFRFEYGNDADYEELEDKSIFDNVDCLKISHH